jgi:hypothetical protein
MESKVTHQEIKREWFTQMPNVITRLLKNPYLYRVYAYLREIAGEEGNCSYSIKYMSEACGISDRKFLECKKILAQEFPEIGMPLIHIKQRFTEHGDRDTDIITILDVWTINSDFKKYKKFPFPNEKATTAEELSINSCDDSCSGGTEYCSPRVANKVLSKKRTSSLNIKKEMCKEKDPDGSTRDAKAPSNTPTILLDIEKREFVGITQEQLEKWKQLFPKIDIGKALTTCIKWHILHGKKRKNWLMTINKWLLNEFPSNDKSSKRDHGPNYEINLRFLNELKYQYSREMKNLKVNPEGATIRDSSRNFDLSLKMLPDDFERLLIKQYC